MFDHLGWMELAVLAVVALFVFGPERLPKVAADAARTLRHLRRMAQQATSDLKAELGPEMADLDLRDLNPRQFVRRHLLDDDEPDVRVPGTPAPTPVGRAPEYPLAAGERPPYDPDAT